MKTDNYKRLAEMKQWSFEQKLDHTIGNIQVFAERMEKVAVSFSGGKDSTVLLDICRRYCNKDMPAFFLNTGNEYPEIIRFVREFENVDFVRPKMKFKQVICKYGFPLISKRNAQYFRQIKHGSEKTKKLRLLNDTCYSLPKKYRGFLDIENLELSEQCCDKLKKEPSNRNTSR
jgi:3'-phosphoadenosine 5'-phosphosulfate sulfotransferase (PAPS reductase)/FAD synthetase